MLPINEHLSKTEKVMIKIEPTIKNEKGEWLPNRDYKLELVNGEIKKFKKQTGETFEKCLYTCNIINDNGSKSQGIYEVPKLSQSGELNYIIRKMIELDLNAGDIFFLGTDEKGYVVINRLGKGSGEEVEDIPTIQEDEEFPPVADEDEIDIKDIPF
jgi:hypothetical protein